MRHELRVRHHSRRTEKNYISWVRRYIFFHGKRHPKELGAEGINAFLKHLAVDREVSASTQSQALCALLFLYRNVLNQEIGELDIVRARRRRRLPVVLTRDEVRILFEHLTHHRLVLSLLYGSGLRLLEGLRLRVKDLDLERAQLIVRDGKGNKDRITLLPERLIPELESYLATVQKAHRRALADGYGTVALPHALLRKYPNAEREWGWQWVFPAANRSRDPRSGAVRRHYQHERAVQRAFKAAVQRAGSMRLATPWGIPLPRIS